MTSCNKDNRASLPPQANMKFLLMVSSILLASPSSTMAFEAHGTFQRTIATSPPPTRTTTISRIEAIPPAPRRRPKATLLSALPSQASPSPSSPSPIDPPRQPETALMSSTTADAVHRFPSLTNNRLTRFFRTDKAIQRTHDYQWNKQNLAIALPALMGLLADPVLSMVDTAFVGRIGAMDLAALGVCTSIFHMAFTVFRASTVATTSLVGSATTQSEKRQITKLSLQLAGVMGTAVLLALRLGGPQLLATMGVASTSPLYKPACDYLFARCWAAPAVVGIVVAEGAFRGNDDSKTPLIASSVAALINLVLDPLLMFPLGMGMAGAAAATAISQVGAAVVYAARMWKRKLLPQKTDDTGVIDRVKVIKSILGANLAMLAKQGSMLVFYTAATALATRMGPAHVATHQIALSLFWLSTYWLDSSSISGQVLMSKNMKETEKARSLTKYMLKFALMQGLAFSAMIVGIGKYVPGLFTQDIGIQGLLLKCLPHIAFQQTLVSLTLIMEGMAIGGNEFRYMAAGTAAATVGGVWQLARANSVIGVWGTAVNTFFGLRFVNAIIGLARVHMGLRKNNANNSVMAEEAIKAQLSMETVQPLTESLSATTTTTSN